MGGISGGYNWVVFLGAINGWYFRVGYKCVVFMGIISGWYLWGL